MSIATPRGTDLNDTALTVAGSGHLQPGRAHAATVVNDVHSRSNPTSLAGRFIATSVDEVCAAVASARHARLPLAVMGARHAMGGQQFRAAGHVLDMSAMDRVLSLDADRGVARVQAGCTWPTLMHELARLQPDDTGPVWGIIQKQTGADRLTLGGAVASNIHGRVIDRGPIVGDLDSIEVVTPDAKPLRCDRTTHADLFEEVVGGYGLFGVVTSVDLRLQHRRRVRRRVRLADIDEVIATLESAARAGCTYGDFQFEIDPCSPGFLRRGVLPWYEPTDDPCTSRPAMLSREGWLQLVTWAHIDKARAFDAYAAHYLATDGQVYWADHAQRAELVEGYHDELDRRLGCCGGEIIAELDVPRSALPAFMRRAAAMLRERRADVIYGTVRLIRAERQTLLPWARHDWACVVLNLHVERTPAARERAGADFRALYDLAIELGGTFYLTYQRFATRGQLLQAHPGLPAFLARKHRRDPAGVLRSDWFDWLQRTLG